MQSKSLPQQLNPLYASHSPGAFIDYSKCPEVYLGSPGLTTLTSPHQKSMWYINLLMSHLCKYKPNTSERWLYAVKLLSYMGYGVKWDDPAKCPEVSWFDTEGGGKEIAEAIRDILHKDYLEESVSLDDSNGDVFEQFKLAYINGSSVIDIDSVS